ncbi:MAG: hypothetical protein LBV74_20860 [Tannerella sp.]|nr:hypothetical protein [Tannerella sp.]
MKRTIAISFLLLANIIILAHVVIPHHHHNGMPVAFCKISLSDDNSEYTHSFHSHSDGENDHSHESDANCTLCQLYIRADLNNSPSSLTSALANFHIDIPTFCLDISSLTDIQGFESLPFRHKPHIISYHSHYIVHSLGLRAPPIC